MAKRAASKALTAKIEELRGQREQLVANLNFIAGQLRLLEDVAAGKLDLGLDEKSTPPAPPPALPESTNGSAGVSEE